MDINTRQRLSDLLRAHGMTEDILDLPSMTHAFLSQMRIALYGGKTSMPVLPTFLKPFGALAEGRPCAEAIAFAQKASAISVTRPGAQSSVPFRYEISA